MGNEIEQESVIVLSESECEALVEMLDNMSGGGVAQMFRWEEPGDYDFAAEPITRALVKVLFNGGREEQVPTFLLEAWQEAEAEEHSWLSENTGWVEPEDGDL